MPNLLKKDEAINVVYSTCVIIPEYCYDYFLDKYNSNGKVPYNNFINSLSTEKDPDDHIIYIVNKILIFFSI